MVRELNASLSIRNGRLFIEDCDAADLAKRFGTPLFVVSENHLRANYRRFRAAFEKFWPASRVRIFPSIKASPITAIRRILTEEGAACDVFGHGELEGALRGRVATQNISVNGSIKDAEIIERCVGSGIRIVLDSPRELELCEEIARDLNKTASILLRVKPFLDDLDLESDFLPGAQVRDLTQLIKYGIPTSEVLPMATRIAEMRHVELIGVHCHMGRHSRKLELWAAWVRHACDITAQISQCLGGWIPQIMNFGGGFPSTPDCDTDVHTKGYPGPTLEEYAQAITGSLVESMRAHGMDASRMSIEVEPGRGIHCDTGIHLTTVRNLKHETATVERHWAELDTSQDFLGIGGLNPEPPFDYIIANKAERNATHNADLVGLTCNAEQLYCQVPVPDLAIGDVIALLNTGSYVEPCSRNFNALPRPGTVLVSADQAELIKRHETVEEVFARDIVPVRFNR